MAGTQPQAQLSQEVEVEVVEVVRLEVELVMVEVVEEMEL